ncbi:hypothetical protein [Maritalea mediterranea]|uniref:Uncharacterized protein n=1 Tax=Maritalea mediterranea TaxID=2909667 RepID=A0ABS9E502_9HYPH|nr:hypothetical protein [Maritalea mediterranea]MCF4097282.1 hypothetical protein [Maritalea mediterranea]
MAVLARLFIYRIRGWRRWLIIIAPIVWFQLALLSTGLYPDYIDAQGGVALEENPFFTPDTAQLHFDEIAQSGQRPLAYLFYVVDMVAAALLAMAFAALIGFGLNAAGPGLPPHATLLLLPPVFLLLADFAENLIFTLCVATAPAPATLLLAAAGVVTGLKFLGFALSALVGICSLIFGLWRTIKSPR